MGDLFFVQGQHGQVLQNVRRQPLDELDDGLNLVVVRFGFSNLDLFALDIQPFAKFLGRNGFCWMGLEPPVVGDSRDDFCDREGDSPVDVKEDRLDLPQNYFVCGAEVVFVVCPIGSQLLGIPYQDQFLHGREQIAQGKVEEQQDLRRLYVVDNFSQPPAWFTQDRAYLRGKE